MKTEGQDGSVRSRTDTEVRHCRPRRPDLSYQARGGREPYWDDPSHEMDMCRVRCEDANLHLDRPHKESGAEVKKLGTLWLSEGVRRWRTPCSYLPCANSSRGAFTKGETIIEKLAHASFEVHCTDVQGTSTFLSLPCRPEYPLELSYPVKQFLPIRTCSRKRSPPTKRRNLAPYTTKVPSPAGSSPVLASFQRT